MQSAYPKRRVIRWRLDGTNKKVLVMIYGFQAGTK